MVKVNFTRLLAETEIGKFEERDVSKPLGNCIHQRTPDIGVDEMAHVIYHSTGEIEIPDEMVGHICEIVDQSNLLAFVKSAVLGALGHRPNRTYKIKED